MILPTLELEIQNWGVNLNMRCEQISCSVFVGLGSRACADRGPHHCLAGSAPLPDLSSGLSRMSAPLQFLVASKARWGMHSCPPTGWRLTLARRPPAHEDSEGDNQRGIKAVLRRLLVLVLALARRLPALPIGGHQLWHDINCFGLSSACLGHP